MQISLSLLVCFATLGFLQPATPPATQAERAERAKVMATEIRRSIDAAIGDTPGHKAEVHSIRDLIVEHAGLKVPARLYRPTADATPPVALMIHGGAFVAGSIDSHDHMARALAAGSGVAILSVGYTLSPEGSIPKQVAECEAVLDWLRGPGAAQLNVLASRVAVVGDSAGATLSALLTLRVRDSQFPLVFQALINPVVDATSSLVTSPETKGFTAAIASLAVEPDQDAKSPENSPLFAKSHAGLPPALVLVSEQDGWAPEGLAYAEALRKAGVSVNVYTLFGVGHLGPDAARATDTAREGLAVAAAAIGAALRPIK